MILSGTAKDPHSSSPIAPSCHPEQSEGSALLSQTITKKPLLINRMTIDVRIFLCAIINMYKNYYVYFITNTYNTVLYAGVTNHLQRRIDEHRSRVDAGSFSSRYKLWKLVYYEYSENIQYAIGREKELKGWVRRKKDELIEKVNPAWKDLYPEICEYEQHAL